MLTLIKHSESAIQNGEMIENSDVFANLRLKVYKKILCIFNFRFTFMMSGCNISTSFQTE
ncbi:MAG: hypothetical protein KIT33_02450 [Candidatus Kapabacteria bacterium]|nr:hypothetical protein [Ignavibacteriota bacterium]MCW5883811.1 hypothetical protein [Candidatus Kapabacteria bacterium]